jgi:hypothetical protein
MPHNLCRDGLRSDTSCDGTSQVIRPTHSCPCPTDFRQPCRCPWITWQVRYLLSLPFPRAFHPSRRHYKHRRYENAEAITLSYLYWKVRQSYNITDQKYNIWVVSIIITNHGRQPDSVRWRTGLSGVPAEQRLLRAQRSTVTHLMRACARRGQSTRSRRTGQSTGLVRCTTGQPRCPTSQSSNGRTLTSGWRGWRTGLSCAPFDSSLHQTASLVVGAINTPTTPHSIASKFSAFTPHTRAIAFNSRHNQRDQILSQVSSSIPINSDLWESDLCSFELLRLDCFFSFSFFLVTNSIVTEARDTDCVVVLAGT